MTPRAQGARPDLAVESSGGLSPGRRAPPREGAPTRPVSLGCGAVTQAHTFPVLVLVELFPGKRIPGASAEEDQERGRDETPRGAVYPGTTRVTSHGATISRTTRSCEGGPSACLAGTTPIT